MSLRKFGFILMMIVFTGGVVALAAHCVPIFFGLLLLNVAAFAFGSQPPRPAFSKAVVRNAWGRFYWLWAPVLYWLEMLNIL
jgi:hypothetical protein